LLEFQFQFGGSVFLTARIGITEISPSTPPPCLRLPVLYYAELKVLMLRVYKCELARLKRGRLNPGVEEEELVGGGSTPVGSHGTVTGRFEQAVFENSCG
jgi:hypothetical protein